MPDPEQPRMEELTETVRRLGERQQELERRLEMLERAAPAPPRATTAPPRPAAAVRQHRLPRFETRMGLTWINRAGVITFVIGVAFFFKYAVDNRWIGETGRVALGVLAGLAALAIGDLLWRREPQRTFAQGVSGAGIAILFVSFYAGFGFYHLVSQPLAFLLMALNTAAAGALALRYDSPAIAALGLLGGYLTPVLLSTGQDRPWMLFGYVLVLNAGAVAAARGRRWNRLLWLAWLATAVLYWSWVFEFAKSDRTAGWVFALIFYSLFAGSAGRVLFAAAQAMVMIQLEMLCVPDAWLFVPLAIAASAGGLAVSERRGWRESPLVVFLSFWAMYAAGHFAFRQHGAVEPQFVLVTLAYFLFFVWVPFRVMIRRAGAGRQDLVLTALNAAFYFVAAYDLLAPGYRAWLGLFAVSLAGLHFVLGREIWSAVRRETRTVLLYLGIALAFLTLAAPIQFAGYRITMAWSLEAAALAWIGARTGEPRLGWGALAVFVPALIRLLAIDASIYPDPRTYSALLNTRFLTFLTAAAALWLSARWLGRGWRALASYVAGHVVMLWALVLEVLGWAERTASPADLLNVKSTAVSILMAAYAVLLVALGVAARAPLNRLLGLGLIAAVVAKLYLYDVWRISRGMYRVAAFAALGLFLLVTSYLYSRYRGSIESWWKDEP